MKRLAGVVGAVAAAGLCALLLGGCGTPDASPGHDQTILALEDLGALGCAAYRIDARPADVVRVRHALAIVQAAMTSEALTMTLVRAALTHVDLDPRYLPLAYTAIGRIEARIGMGQLTLPRDSLGFRMVGAFVTACDAALGVQV